MRIEPKMQYKRVIAAIAVGWSDRKKMKYRNELYASSSII